MAAGLLLALLAPAPVRGASREEKAYGLGTNEFAQGLYLPAETTFSNFVTIYTNSPLRTNAILFLARSRIGLSNYSGALELLKREMPPGKLAPDFVFWMARAYYDKQDYTNAIERCAYLLQNFAADPPLPLRATLLQARALAKLPDWPGVITLLSEPAGVFQSAIQGGKSGQEAVDGYFLLGAACLNLKQYPNAEAAMAKINTNSLSLDLQWQRQDLLCRVWLEEGRLDQALEGSTNLLALASRAGRDQRIATAFLRGVIFERTNQISDALQAYSDNLEKGFPAEVKRRALRKTIDLMLQQDQPSNTMRWLDDFIQQRTNEPMLDLARFHLGDLELKAWFASLEPGSNGPPAADTNLLLSAITNLDRVADFPSSELLGRACLDRGWCDWAQGNYAAAATNFSAAVTQLPYSENLAVALLKLGDACFRLGDYTNAAIHYNHLIQDYATMPNVTNGLFDLALYQLVQASLNLTNEAAARAAMEHILTWFPISGYGEQSLLLLGEDASNRKNNYPEARATLQRLLATYPDTPLRPRIQLAIARTYEQEGDWTNVFNTYTNLEANTHFATNPLRSQVEFSLALACAKAGLESNALARMSNVVSQFTNDPNAALAQNWIGNYHMNHGNYVDADYAFQQLSNPRSFPNAGDLAWLAWQARLMAGLAARNHLDYAGASNDFYSVVIADTNVPAAFLAQAQFQFGYTVFQQFQQHDRTNLSLLKTATDALSKVTNSAPTNFMGTLAIGQLGNCYLALADLDPSNTNAYYAKAILMFQAVLQDTNDSPVDVTARSEAKFGLGLVAERQNRAQEALGHFCDVLYDLDTTHADPAWVKEAGVKAAALYEEQKDWLNAAKVYRRVQDVVPSLHHEMQMYLDRIKAAALAN